MFTTSGKSLRGLIASFQRLLVEIEFLQTGLLITYTSAKDVRGCATVTGAAIQATSACVTWALVALIAACLAVLWPLN